MDDQAKIHRKSLSNKVKARIEAAVQMSIDFANLPDKDSAWQDLYRLASDLDRNVRSVAAEALGPAFSKVPDKDAAWQDLHRLAGDKDSYVRSQAAEALGAAFSAVPDKDAAWQDLHRLAGDKDSYVRSQAAEALGAAFSVVPDKDAAWQDLHRLAGDKESYVRSRAAEALRAAFSEVPDKGTAWQNLIRLASDEGDIVRLVAAEALGPAFSEVPDKDAAWQDLHRLTGDKNHDVRSNAIRTLRAAFSEVPDKDAAWQDLHRLTANEDRYVRVSANHFLGRASIFKATETESEEEFSRELENALQYFERSAAEAEYSNPAKFCLPFYRSFYSLTCKSEISEGEVEKYLKEAKDASEGSRSKEDLLEAVENLSNALKETQRLRERGFEAAKYDLNFYRRYCDRAAELLDETEEKAPGATRLIRKGLPIIDHQIKKLLKDIKDKSEEICKTGSPLEAELGCKIQKYAASALEKTYNPIEVQKKVNQILGDINTWSDSIQDLHLRKFTKGKLEEAKNEDIVGQLEIINILQVATMSGKNSSPKYVIESSKVQIAEGEGHHQEMEVSSGSKRESETHQRPWHKDRNYLIALIAAIITAIGVIVAYIQL